MGTIRFDIEEVKPIEELLKSFGLKLEMVDRYCTIRIPWFFIDDEKIGKDIDLFLEIKRSEEGIYSLQPIIIIDKRELMKEVGKDKDLFDNSFKGTAIEKVKKFMNIKDLLEYLSKIFKSELHTLVARKLKEAYGILYGYITIKEDL